MRCDAFYQKFALILLLLILIGLACGSGGAAQQIAPPGGTIPMSQEAVDRLKQNFYQSLLEASSSHEAQLRITNEEITSLVAIELTQTGQLPLNNPQIWFTGGRIFLTGEAKPFGPLSFDSRIVATAVVNEGRMVVEVQEAQMSPFDFPESLLESMAQTVNETLDRILVDADLKITRLEILEGEMFVRGTRGTP